MHPDRSIDLLDCLRNASRHLSEVLDYLPQVAAAFLVNFPVFGENLGRMAAALRSRYGMSVADTAFFDFFAELPPDFEPDALAVIGAGLCGCADERDIKRSARLLQFYELDFWNAVAGN